MHKLSVTTAVYRAITITSLKRSMDEEMKDEEIPLIPSSLDP
jgi:hypothetical protein